MRIHSSATAADVNDTPYGLAAGIFTGTLVLTNVLNTKIFSLFGFTFPAGILTFPLTFLAADALTYKDNLVLRGLTALPVRLS